MHASSRAGCVFVDLTCSGHSFLAGATTKSTTSARYLRDESFNIRHRSSVVHRHSHSKQPSNGLRWRECSKVAKVPACFWRGWLCRSPSSLFPTSWLPGSVCRDFFEEVLLREWLSDRVILLSHHDKKESSHHHVRCLARQDTIPSIVWIGSS
jgi:hypothetical protein